VPRGYGYKLSFLDWNRAVRWITSFDQFCLDLYNGVIILPKPVDAVRPEDRPFFHEVSLTGAQLPVCQKSVAQLLEVIKVVGGRKEVAPKQLKTLLPVAVVCIDMKRQRVLAICRQEMSSWWEWDLYAKKIDSVTLDALLALVGKEFYLFAPEFLSSEEHREFHFMGPAIVLGGTFAGKTTFVTNCLLKGWRYPYAIYDYTGEYEEKKDVIDADVVDLTLSLSELTVEDFLDAFDAAARATLGAEANWTVVQQNIIVKVVQQYGLDLQAIMSAVLTMATMERNMSAQIVAQKLGNLCAYDASGTCQPHPAVSTPGVERVVQALLQKGRVILRPAVGNAPTEQRQFLSTFLLYGLLYSIIRRNLMSEVLKKYKVPVVYFIIDEAHLVIPRQGKSVLTLLARWGRHAGLSAVFITQHPLDLPEDVSDVVVTNVYFGLHMNESVYGIDPSVFASLPPGAGIAVVRGRGIFYIPPGKCIPQQQQQGSHRAKSGIGKRSIFARFLVPDLGKQNN